MGEWQVWIWPVTALVLLLITSVVALVITGHEKFVRKAGENLGEFLLFAGVTLWLLSRCS